MNKTFQSALEKLDQLIGAPPPTIYAKRRLYGSRVSMSSFDNTFTYTKKSDLKRNNTSTNLLRTSSFCRLRKNSFVCASHGLRNADLQRIYLSKCKDLKIPPVPQLEKRYLEVLHKSLQNRVMNFKENRFGPCSAEVIGQILSKNFDFSKLILSKNLIGDKGLQLLTKNLLENKSIIHLDISSNDIRSEGACFFFKEIKKHESIISIDISSHEGLNKNRIGPAGIWPIREILQESRMLLYLSLADTFLGVEGLLYVVEGLKNNKTLIYLNVSNNQFGPKPMQAFFDSVSTTQLYELCVSGNKISSDGSEVVGDFLALQSVTHCPLQILHVGHNDITAKGSSRVLSGLKQNNTLTTLNIDNNPLSENAANSLLYCFEENFVLINLDLSNCSILDEGVEKLSEALVKNLGLQTLILKRNQIKDRGIFHLANSLETNTKLNHIDLSFNQMTSTGGVYLFNSLKKNSTLNTLVLKDNYLKDDVGQLITDITRNKPNLQTIKLEGTQIGIKFLTLISTNLEKNKSLFKATSSKLLKKQILNVSKKDFNTEKIKEEIELRKKEEIDMAKRLEIHKRKVEELQQSFIEKLAEIEEEYKKFYKQRVKLSEELADFDYKVSIAKNKYETTISKIKNDITRVNKEIETFESLSKV